MSASRILGISVLAAGIVCLYFGVNSSNAFVDQIAESATGRFTEHTMWYIIGGIAMIIGGGALFVRGRQKL